MRYNQDSVEKLLLGLQNANPAIKGVILLSVEGLPISSTVPRDLDKAQLSALSATILALGKKKNSEMNNGEFNHLYIEGSNGGILIFQLSKFEVLVLLTYEETDLELLIQSLNDFKFEDLHPIHLNSK
ncbi:MAG: roadblock/LC7 domain-containing protein [Candidatus Heimdallarchaeota archaeon]